MTTFQHIPVDGTPAQPWRNGGGRTRELFTWPGGDAPWQLRISVADIDADGPFSAFEDVDRWFAVLQGAGVELDLPGGPRSLTRNTPPLRFDGRAAPGCRLIDGPTRDFNLMLRHRAGHALLLDAQPGQAWSPAAPLRGLFSTAALQLQVEGEATQSVAAWSLLLAAAPAPRRWTITGLPPGERALWLAFTPQAALT